MRKLLTVCLFLLPAAAAAVTLTLSTEGVTGSPEAQLDWTARHGVVAFVNGAPIDRLTTVTVAASDFDVFAAFQLVEPPPAPEGEAPDAARWDILVDVSGDPMTPPQRAAVRQAIIDALEVAFPCPAPPWGEAAPDCATSVRNARKLALIHRRTLEEADLRHRRDALEAAEAAANAREQ